LTRKAGRHLQTIALYGLSADPPHLGHVAILHWLASHVDLTFVWAVDNPLKPRQTSLEHRAAMLQKILPADDALHYRPDLSRPYTLESVELVEQEYPQVPLWLVIGSDLLSQVHQWHQAPTLAQKVELLVFPRAHSPIVSPQENFRWHLASCAPPEVSSSELRQELRNRAYKQGEIKMANIPEAVQEYITAHQLYSEGLSVASD
jgi:nicotinate-nucleotide adenylyltransferase